MKIALIGNCQLQQIGWLLKAFFEQQKIPFEVVWYEPIFALGDTQAPIVPLFNALQSADVIYGQYHDGKWNALSTDSLRRYFDIKLVPTLESLASYPQLNYFSQGKLNFNLYTVDFRMLDLYLAGVPAREAHLHYAGITPDPAAIDALVQSAAAKYARLHAEGKLAFDYSQAYLQTVRDQGLGAYFTHNHPNNSQLQWLANAILQDLGSPRLVSLEPMPQILFDTKVPRLGDTADTGYRIRSTEVGLEAGCKINYAFFSSYDRGFLREELAESVYTQVCHRPGAARPTPPGTLALPQAAATPQPLAA